MKYGNRCAYCGCVLGKIFHVDHIKAHWHSMTKEQCERSGIKKGEDCVENFNPSCPRCNRWKSTFDIEMFRKEIGEQLKRLYRYNNNYRLAFDYGLITENNEPIKFYFEKLNNIL
jgi:hypothetical protein